jgi:hypothetical protein
MTDEQLISYCEAHCQTQRALFNSDQINRMIALAGYPAEFVREIPGGQWHSLHSDMEDLCKLARERLATVQAAAPAAKPAPQEPQGQKGLTP